MALFHAAIFVQILLLRNKDPESKIGLVGAGKVPIGRYRVWGISVCVLFYAAFSALPAHIFSQSVDVIARLYPGNVYSVPGTLLRVSRPGYQVSFWFLVDGDAVNEYIVTYDMLFGCRACGYGSPDFANALDNRTSDRALLTIKQNVFGSSLIYVHPL